MSCTIPYYDTQQVWSRNALITMVVGARGLGKTYGFKRDVIRRAIKRGEHFILLRRFQTELVKRGTFFDDVAHEFPEYDFRVHGSVAQYATADTREDRKRDWSTIGHFISLTSAQKHKGASYHEVTTVIFDEFIIEKGFTRYIDGQGEVDILLNFMSTVDRYQDRMRVIMLANSVSIMNPYFDRFDINPNSARNSWVTRRDGEVIAHFPDSADFAEHVYTSRLGKLIKDTEYADYAVGNEFDDNSDWLLDIKDVKARYQYTLETKAGTFSVWYAALAKTYFVQRARPKREKVYTLLPTKMREDKVLISTSERLLVLARGAFKSGRMYFDRSETRNAFIEVFK